MGPDKNGQVTPRSAANLTAFWTLEPDARYRYPWQTLGYNRGDTVAAPGAYRINFGQPIEHGAEAYHETEEVRCEKRGKLTLIWLPTG